MLPMFLKQSEKLELPCMPLNIHLIEYFFHIEIVNLNEIYILCHALIYCTLTDF
jgi:hypothetical protein